MLYLPSWKPEISVYKIFHIWRNISFFFFVYCHIDRWFSCPLNQHVCHKYYSPFQVHIEIDLPERMLKHRTVCRLLWTVLTGTENFHSNFHVTNCHFVSHRGFYFNNLWLYRWRCYNGQTLICIPLFLCYAHEANQTFCWIKLSFQ